MNKKKIKKKDMSFKKPPLRFILSISMAAYLFTGCGDAASSASSAAAQPEESANVLADSAAAKNSSSDAAANAAPVFTVSSLDNSKHTITVNSSEKVTVIPDIAEVVYAVRTEAKDAAACQQKNTEDVNQVIDLLKSLGIAETSIQTSNYYMQPVYNYSNNTQRITGYEATATLTVSDLPIDGLGNILSESVKAGINNIQSITYQSSKYDEGYANALTLAMESAKNKAGVLAQAGGCTLGGIAGICENSNYGEARYTDYALSSQMRSYGAIKQMAEDESLNIMPGEVDIEVNITVEYFIQ